MKMFNVTYSSFIFLAWSLITLCMKFTHAGSFTYIVHMDKSAMPKAFTSSHEWYSATIDSLEVASDSPTTAKRILYTYDNAIHGFSAVLSREALQKLEKSPGFVTAYPDKVVELHTTHTPEFLSLNAESGLWPASEFGKDVIIGVMDSGIWPESKSYNDDGMAEVPKKWKGICETGVDFNSSMCNRKLIGARYFNIGAKAANLNTEIDDDDTPRDINGHGTHTSTTAAGNYVEGVSFFGYAKGTARGIAPRSHLAMYRVFGTVGAGSDLLAGIDQAIADGVDIISISMGTGWTPLYEDPIAIAGFAAMENGILMSMSAGNAGPGPGMVENGVPWLLTVGASTTDRQNSAVLTLGNGISITGWSEFPANALLVDREVVYNKTLLACNSSELLSEVSYKIVICSQEFGYVVGQIETVKNSNIAGAIFISDQTGFMEKDDIACPGIVIKPAQATELISYVTTASSPTVTMKFQHSILGAKPAPAVSFFSSRGPSKTYPTILKPDLIAPGSKILAAWIPLTPSAFLGPNMVLSSEYTFQSGTSMSAPHAAGVAALLKGAHPGWSPAAIRSAMMTTARQVGNDGSPIRDNGANLTYATPLDIGAGPIDPNKALNPGLIYDADFQDYINHLCLMNFTRKQIRTITRSSNYNCSDTSDLNYPSFMAFFQNTSSTIYRFHRTVTNVGGEVASYRVRVVVPVGTSVTVTPDALVFSDMYQKLSFNVTVDIQQMEAEMAHGSLVWEQIGGSHIVRSPIVVFRKF